MKLKKEGDYKFSYFMTHSTLYYDLEQAKTGYGLEFL